MSLSSVIELLREAALKLDLLKEDGNQDVYGLDESEIASIIHQHYQVNQVYIEFCLIEIIKDLLFLSYLFITKIFLSKLTTISVCVFRSLHVLY